MTEFEENVAPERNGLASPGSKLREPRSWPAPSAELQTLFSEITEALKSTRYGSIVLTIHEGEVVEVIKTVRRRRRRSSLGC